MKRVALAAALSVLAHAALLVPYLVLRGPAKAAPARTAAGEVVRVDVLTRAPAPAGRAVAEGAEEPRGASSARPAARADAAKPPPDASKPSAQEATAAAPPTPGGGPAGEATAAADAPAGDAPARGGAAQGTAPSAPGAGAAVPDGVEEALHQRLQAGAARCYPSASRRFHETGTSEVAFCVGTEGRLQPTRLARSSGSERLDKAALDCVVGGSEPFPAAQGRCFALPVRFGD